MPRFPRPVDATAVRDARFAEVVRTYEAPLSRYLVRMVGDVELARDLAQETFLSAYSAWPDPEPTHLSAWLYRIATNHALSHLRRRKVIRWVPFSQLAAGGVRADRDTDAGSLDHLFPSEASPSDGIVEADAIETILDGMDSRDRATLLLHAAGFSGAEIGAQLNGSPASARTRLSRARAHFREQYARLGTLASAAPDRKRPTPPITDRPGPGTRHLRLLRPANPATGEPSEPTAPESTEPLSRPNTSRSGGTSA